MIRKAITMIQNQILSTTGHALYGQTTEFIKLHWVKCMILLMVFYLGQTKDVNFQIQLLSSRQASQTEALKEPRVPTTTAIPVSTTTKQVATTTMEEEEMGIGFNQLFKKLWPFSIESTTTSLDYSNDKASKVEKGSQKMGNLTPIFSPDYAEKNGISRKEVDAKMLACKKYVKRFADIAVAEMHKYGIPASIKLAQALLESNVGDSRLCKENSNHFGIKCFAKNCSKSHCSNFTDDSHKDFFRKYKSSWESFRAHSEVLQSKRYQPLRKISRTDYQAWAHGLKKAGYATDKKYAEKLILIIKALELWKYDQ